MYANTSLSENGSLRSSKVRHQRIEAAATASFKHGGERTRLDRLYQQGSAKLRFPKVHNPTLEAVLINTAGGLTGGDKLDWNLHLAEDSDVVATTQACEKSYRSSSGSAQVSVSINLEAGSCLHWLPQETICYEGSSLSRNLIVEMHEKAEFLGIEGIVLGREAMGETIDQMSLHDRWRIRRSGKLVMGDDLRLSGTSSSIAKLGGKSAVTSFVYVSPKSTELLEGIANSLRQACTSQLSGFSAFEGKITGRIVAKDSYHLRHALIPVLKQLRGSELPRVWRI